ncbi:hypothetical protein [Roseibium aggregatum]|uniref:Serine protease n=1 Tax=Roseibium aggregatum TaxID=187304 RepID=A0A939J500_9HYPH|nr:hypothetical protein [Roseibium aggregatum]MBN9672162.1 hypothetical protein [Roseibium aggregatum]
MVSAVKADEQCAALLFPDRWLPTFVRPRIFNCVRKTYLLPSHHGLGEGKKTEHFCWYTGDTREGSSGAPVFNKYWEVVALHHKAVPKTNVNGEVIDINGRTMSEERYKQFPELVDYAANEGIRASRLLQRLQQATFDKPEHEAKRDRLLKLWQSREARSLRRRLQFVSNEAE